MSNVEALKEQARRHEQKEEWQKACDQYMLAIAKLDDEEQVDIGLYNRVGDLLIRTGDFEKAVEHFDKAADLYVESELPNNAIAICKKVIRHLPTRFQAYLRMGKIRAQQGFLLDARENFLTYAEKVQAAGDMEEALRALVEFAGLAPEDTEIRMAVAALLIQNERSDEALEQLAAGYSVVRSREDEEAAAAFEARILELDPDADLDALAEAAATGPEQAFEMGIDDSADDVFGDFGDISIPGDSGVEAVAEAHDPSEAGTEDEDGTDEDDGVELGGFAEIAVGDDGDEPGMDDEDEEVLDPLAGAFLDAGGDASEGEDDLGFGATAGLDPDEEAFPEPDDLAAAAEAAWEDASGDDLDAGIDLQPADEGGGIEVSGADAGLDDLDDDEGDFAIGGDLPLMSFDEDEDAGAEEADEVEGGEPLPFLTEPDEVASWDAEVESDRGLDDVMAAPTAQDPRAEWDGLRAACTENPGDAEAAQRLVELAFKLDDQDALIDSYLVLAGALSESGEQARAQGVYQQVLSLDPSNELARQATAGAESGRAPAEASEVQSASDYVDLGSLIFDEDEGEKTTRFTVAYEEPTGDEDADFARMLHQFKAKVAENFDHSDVRAHHDLGTAYKEMGLLDEAVEKFQEALRASPDHLPTYELLGQTFMEKGEGVAAVRVLERALKVPHDIEDELIGIYYHLARAHEETGNTGSAVEFYDRVFSLDINFADVTERLRKLRPS